MKPRRAAATVRNILDFPQAFSPPADIVTLDRNYRVAQPILAAANGVIHLEPRLVTVPDEADLARYVVARVLEDREIGARLKQRAVLFRASQLSGPLALELARRSIPFVQLSGLKFLDSAHVKDMLALLRFAQNPRRAAGFRVMQLLPGVGPGSA